MFVTAGLADFFTLAKALGIEAKDASALFDSFNPGMLVPMRVQRILSANFAIRRGSSRWRARTRDS